MGFSIEKASVFLTAMLAAVAQGHMIMRTPVPYGKSSLNNSPLDASGSDFPCKLRSGAFDKEGASNVMAIGSPQTLSFTGSAVHGGGSCQIALTTDLAPTKDSKWMVIKSIIGGCPANVPGNLPADPAGTGASTFQYTIPEGIAPGEYSLSWSWFNRVGNREMYQNCAPVTVTGGTSKRDTQDRRRFEAVEAAKLRARQQQSASFPDLFVCNLAGINSCTTQENFEYEFPNPGPEVQTAGNGPFTMLSGGGGAGGPAQQPTGAGSQPTGSPQPSYEAPNPASGPATVTQPAGSQDQPTGAPTGNPQGYPQGNPHGNGPPAGATGSAGNFADGASSSSSPAATSNVVNPVNTDVTPIQTPAPDSRSGDTTGSNSSNTGDSGTAAGTQSGPCTSEGEYNCLTSSFQRCASGQWSPVMPLAAGMQCSTPGLSANFAMNAGKVKRHSHGAHFRIFDSVH
ncbi:uncharacterized protein A1O9_01676 [Exophiala aquamarina CBS 119918]|uniref:DNA-directed RNA polymerase n=1 Tax=Exophiala aquamarina CBS 119918 TaxID=1182545 RepID=A0A072PWF8_9EURO|nr:uncharacterized protein A1O9_01676 [Exophiala aquamarina CBS 119918]KEF63698.1 hypothetical protein A1O9_01676 [Exophiala aquamarina CBS 119918]